MRRPFYDYYFLKPIRCYDLIALIKDYNQRLGWLMISGDNLHKRHCRIGLVKFK